MHIINRETTLVDVDALRPHPRNVNQGNIGLIGESIGQNGFYGSLVVQQSTGHILRGNHTWQAARQAGATEIPVTFVDVDDETALRILLVDNRATREGIDDSNALAVLLRELAATPAALQGTGYDGDALDELLADLGQMQPEMAGDPDAVPEAPEVPVTRRGDVITLGQHRLMCGDSLSSVDLSCLLGAEQVSLVFTDPPYNNDYSSRVDEQRRKPWGGIVNNNMPEGAFAQFLDDVCAACQARMGEGACAYLWTDWHHYDQVRPIFARAFAHKATIVWDKGHFGLGTYYRTQHELLLFGCKGEHVATWNAGSDECDVWGISRDASGDYAHPTQKPVALAQRAIRNSSQPGEAVLDLFGGSGSTLVACEATGRRCYMMEIEPAYCDVTAQRWQDLTGQTAVREQVADDARVLTG